MSDQHHTNENKKFTTYLRVDQIEWLRLTALKETSKRKYEVTAAQILRKLIDKAMNEASQK